MAVAQFMGIKQVSQRRLSNVKKALFIDPKQAAFANGLVFKYVTNLELKW